MTGYDVALARGHADRLRHLRRQPAAHHAHRGHQHHRGHRRERGYFDFGSFEEFQLGAAGSGADQDTRVRP